MQLNGVAHVTLTVRDSDACLPFYEKLPSFFERKCPDIELPLPTPLQQRLGER